MPASHDQVRMMIGRAMAEATATRASPYLVAHVARGLARLVVVITSEMDS
jgi:hypothetical protein